MGADFVLGGVSNVFVAMGGTLNYKFKIEMLICECWRLFVACVTCVQGFLTLWFFAPISRNLRWI